MTVRDGNGNEAHDGDAVRGNEHPGAKGSPEPPPRGTMFKNIRLTDDQNAVDALYGLEPVFEPGGPEARNLTEFVAVQSSTELTLVADEGHEVLYAIGTGAR